MKLNINLTRKRFQQIYCTLNKNLMLCLGIRTHNPLLKPFIFFFLCFIWHLQDFSLLSNHFSIECLLICSPVMYSKCYLFLKVSPSSSCPLQLQKPVHLGQDTVLNFFFCHVFMSLPSILVHSCRSFCSFLGYDSSFHEIVQVCCRAFLPSQIPAIAVDQPLIPLAEQTQ